MRPYLYIAWNVRPGQPALADPAQRAALIAILERACTEMGAVCVNVAALPDQVHLLMRMPADHTVPWIAARCKRRAQAGLSERFSALAAAAGREPLWATGFQARVLAPEELGAVDRYITNGIRWSALHVADNRRLAPRKEPSR